MQAAVVFAHGCPIAAGEFVNVHGNLDHGAVQCAESVEELADVAGVDAGTQFSPWLFIWLGHRITSLT